MKPLRSKLGPQSLSPIANSRAVDQVGVRSSPAAEMSARPELLHANWLANVAAPKETDLYPQNAWLNTWPWAGRPWLVLGITLGLGLAISAFAVEAESPETWARRLELTWLTEAKVQTQLQQTAPLTAAEDAAGGCDGIKDGRWGFHTGLAKDPWWQVDLGELQPIARVVIWNRTDAVERAARIRVRLSENGTHWQTVYEHDGTTFFGFKDQRPLEVKLANPVARFVRLQLPGTSFLHLDEVEVFGPADPARNLALHRAADQISLSQWSSSHTQPLAPDWAALTQEALSQCQRLSRALAVSGARRPVTSRQLEQLGEQLKTVKDDPGRQGVYLEARRAQRQLLLANPLLNFEAILFTKRMPSSYNHMSDQYYGWWSKPGGGIFVLRNFKTGPPTLQGLTDSFREPGSFLRPTLDYDAKKVLFAWCHYYPTLAAEQNKLDKRNVPEDAFFHLFEMNLDGRGLRQLTHGKYDDFDGRYLPDGRIVFLSTRRGQSLQAGRESAAQTLVRNDLPDIYVRCGGDASRPVAVYTLHTMEADGSHLCAISPFEMFEWTPEVAHDGSILYSRWDYIDRDNMPYMKLWSIGPEGANARLIYGNYTRNLFSTFEPRCVPNSSKIVFTASAHHSQTMGSLVLLDPSAGTEGKEPIVRLTPEVCFPEGEGWPKTYYADPWPLSEQCYLVAWGYEGFTVPGTAGWDRWHLVQRPPNGMALYLFDAAGGKTLLYDDPQISSADPIPIQPRPRPPALANPVAWNGAKAGGFLLANVYEGLKTVPRGDIKALRIVAVPGKTHPVMNFPNMGITADDPGKCVLGTVPVEVDGSAYFRVPAGVIVFFQALDARGQAVQTMRSATHVQPGQTLSCIGCHENRTEAPPPKAALAATRPPSRITPGPDGSWPVRFDRLVQPVLDRYCVSCHNPRGSEPLAAKLDLASAKSYQALVHYGKPSLYTQVWTGYRRGFSIEGEGLAQGSALLAYLRTDPAHAKLPLDQDSQTRLITWMDTYAQRLGAFSPAQEKNLLEFRASLASLLQEE